MPNNFRIKSVTVPHRHVFPSLIMQRMVTYRGHEWADPVKETSASFSCPGCAILLEREHAKQPKMNTSCVLINVAESNLPCRCFCIDFWFQLNTLQHSKLTRNKQKSL